MQHIISLNYPRLASRSMTDSFVGVNDCGKPLVPLFLLYRHVLGDGITLFSMPLDAKNTATTPSEPATVYNNTQLMAGFLLMDTLFADV